MMFLAAEILFYLILALIIGAMTGWALRGIQARRRLKNLEKVYRINMASLETKKSTRKKQSK